MRVAIDTCFPFLADTQVWLDGKQEPCVVSADDEEGYIEVLDYEQIDEKSFRLLSNDLIIRKGIVQIRIIDEHGIIHYETQGQA